MIADQKYRFCVKSVFHLPLPFMGTAVTQKVYTQKRKGYFPDVDSGQAWPILLTSMVWVDRQHFCRKQVRAMSLKERLKEDLKTAMKAKDATGLAVIRMVNSEIKNREIATGTELDDAGVEGVIATGIKKRREAAEMFAKGGRNELAAEEKAQIEKLLAYMPKQLDEEAVAAIIKEVVAEVGATSPGEMGAVMKSVMPKVKGKADGQLVNRLVKEALL